MVTIQPIHNDADHTAALARIRTLWNAPVGSPEFEELDTLATLVDAYERKRYPIPAPEPRAVVEFMLDQGQLTRLDLLQIAAA